jgi:AraC-like DNA-binding protein
MPLTLGDIRPFVRCAAQFIWRWENSEFSLGYDCRIFAILNGEAWLRTRDNTYRLKKGAVMFFNAAEPYNFRAVEGEKFSIIVINLDLTYSRSDVTSFVQPGMSGDFDPTKILERLELPELEKPIIIPDDSGLADKVRELFEEYHSSSPYRDTRLSALATDFIISAVRLSQVGTSHRAKLIAAAKSYIHENYGEPITNNDIAAALGYHPYYLSRLFNKEVGISLHKYLNEHRLRIALHLLTLSTEPIEKIAESCGFSSPAHFTASFKAKYGKPPSAFRKIT